MGDRELGHGAQGVSRAQAMMLATCSALRRVVDGATRDHRRLRLSLLLTAAGVAAWVVYRVLS